MSLKKNEIAACVVVAAGIALALAVGAGVFPTAAVAARLSPTPTPSPSPSPTPAPTPTPEPSPTLAPITDDLSVIPDLVGRDYETEIQDSDLYQHYRISVTEEYSSEVEEGKVIRQEPMPGTVQTQQSPTIQLYVSAGPMLVDMPKIVGFPLEDARTLLEAMEIQYTIQPVDNDGSYTTNQVVRCTLNGAELVPGTRLDIETDIITIEVAGLKPEPTPTAQATGE